MSDKETIVKIFEDAEIEHEDWNDRFITVDDQHVEFHFDADGNLKSIIGRDD